MARLLPVLTLAALATLGITGHAQVADTSALTGTAVDANGHPLPGTTVTITRSADPAESRSTVTDDRGRYQFSQLPVGTYDVTFGLMGFKRQVVPGVLVHSDTKMALTGSLTPGAPEESQVVASDAFAVGPADDLNQSPDSEVAPQRLVTVLPRYPRDAPRGTAGTVSVTLNVDATGRPYNVQPAPEHDISGLRDVGGVLAEALQPGPVFRDAVVGAVSQWVYAPPLQDDVTLLVQFTFLAEGRVRLVRHQVSRPVQTLDAPLAVGLAR